LKRLQRHYRSQFSSLTGKELLLSVWGRVSFLDTLQKSTVLTVRCPPDETTKDMIGEEEL
jgi:phosphoglycerate dehydrogenase-like enzyme